MNSRPLPLPAEPIDTETPLWRFALSLWQEPDAARAALALQAKGCAVNHLLVASYLAREGYLWGGSEPAEIRRWREEYTQALRTLRQNLPKNRDDLAPLRTVIAQAELESERMELGCWYHWLARHPLPRTPAHPASRLLAENLIAAATNLGPDTLSLLADLAGALIRTESRATFLQELQAVLDQVDLQP